MWWLTFSSNKCWTVSCSESGVQLSGVRTKQLKTLLGQEFSLSRVWTLSSQEEGLWMWHLGNIKQYAYSLVQRFSQYVNLTSVFSFPSGNQCSRKQLSDQQWALDTRHRRLEKVGRSESRERGACYNQLSGHGLAASFNTKLPRNRIWESSQNK